MGIESSDPASSTLSEYLERISRIRKETEASEGSYYPALQRLLESLAAGNGHPRGLRVLQLPRRGAAGAPDFQVARGDKVVGYLEAKPPGADLERVARSEQLKRYLGLPNLVLTDCYEFRLFRLGRQVARGALESPCPCVLSVLDPTPDRGRAVLELLDRFFDFAVPRARTARSLAVELARRTRFLEAAVEALLEAGAADPSELDGFYRTFSGYLVGLTSRQFADLYAQTVTYGLFAARARTPGRFTRRDAFDGIPRTLGILRDVFRYISLGDRPPEFEWIVNDIAEVLDAADLPRILARYFHEGKGEDPILHFYETFLGEYDPANRERRGVYFTRQPVVSYIVRSLHRILQRDLGLRDGFADPSATVLDPAAGTLTFPVEVFRIAAETFRETYGQAAVPALIRDQLLGNVHAFELMMAPYAIGHLKMGLVLEEMGHPLGDDERFQLYLTDTLTTEDPKQSALPGMGALWRESRAAQAIKLDRPVCVVLGNPPYSGHSANRRGWIDDFRDGYLRPDGSRDSGYHRSGGQPLGDKNPKWLQNDYVKFLRFAQWKIDQRGEGVVGFVTDDSWLDGATFRGMRESLLASFDQVYLLDLHGNSKKKERAPDGGRDENVFDIRQGVAIVFLVKRPGLAKRVCRFDLQGTRRAKDEWLAGHDVLTTPWVEIEPRPPLHLFAAGDRGLEEHYARFPSLPEIFPVSSVGVVTARDAFVTDLDREVLLRRIQNFRHRQNGTEVEEARLGLVDTGSWSKEKARSQVLGDEDWRDRVASMLYRPFQARHVFYADSMVERPRRAVMRHLLGGGNLGLVVPRQCKEDFGAFVTDGLAGHKSASAYDINYVFPLFLRPEADLFGERPGPGLVPNLDPGFRRRLAAAYPAPPSPEEVLGYVYAVLYSEAYRRCYGDLLRLGFPRIPFPRRPDLFATLAALGGELIDLHLLRPERAGPSTVRFEGSGSGQVGVTRRELRAYRPGEQRVYVNRERQCFSGLRPEVWAYRTGGYQVLGKWLEDRSERKLSAGEIRGFCRIAGAIERTLELQAEIDRRYPEVEAPAVS